MAKHALSHERHESQGPGHAEPEASTSEELRAPRAGEPLAPTHDRHEPTHQEHTSQHTAQTAEHASHAVDMWKLLLTFATLLMLTALTVAVTWQDMGYSVNLTVALVIAFAKAVVVALYFMHLRYDSPFNSLIMIVAVLFVALFIGISVLDTREYAPMTIAPRETLP